MHAAFPHSPTTAADVRPPVARGWRIALILATGIALAIAGYLSVLKLSGRISSLAGCGGEGGCANLLGSRWANWFLLPVSLWSMLVYAPLLLLALLGLTTATRQRIAAVAVAVLATAACWFLVVQAVIERAFCPYCCAMHVCSLVALVCVGRYLLVRDPQENLRTVLLAAPLAASALAILIAGQLWGPQVATFEITQSDELGGDEFGGDEFAGGELATRELANRELGSQEPAGGGLAGAGADAASPASSQNASSHSASARPVTQPGAADRPSADLDVARTERPVAETATDDTTHDANATSDSTVSDPAAAEPIPADPVVLNPVVPRPPTASGDSGSSDADLPDFDALPTTRPAAPDPTTLARDDVSVSRPAAAEPHTPTTVRRQPVAEPTEAPTTPGSSPAPQTDAVPVESNSRQRTDPVRPNNSGRPNDSARPSALAGAGDAASGRVVGYFGGAIRYTVATMPIVGRPTATKILVKYFDYTCPACKRMHEDLDRAIQAYPAELAVLVIPCPLARACNPHATAPKAGAKDPHADACQLAAVALAVWRHEPTKFARFHHELFDRQGKVSGKAAEIMASSLIGEPAVAAAADDPWINDVIKDSVAIYGRLKDRNPKMPKLLLGERKILHGVVADQAAFQRVLREQLQLK